jgi:hypothetical protein
MKIFPFFFPLLAKICELFQSTVTLKTLTVIPSLSRRVSEQLGGRCWYAKGILLHWVVAIATRSLGPIAQYIKY